MNKTCKQCGQGFEVTESDLDFLIKVSPVYSGKKYEIPAPTMCSDCRQQRRISWRNERSLYHRECSSSGEKIIAMYGPEAVFPVYDNDIWWGDSWDAKDFGREADFSRGFFEQMKELHDVVPHFSLAVLKSTMQNSDFCNHAGYLKNCYLIYNTDYAERCMYSKGVNRCFDCLDCFKVYESEACYECMNSYNCKFCTYVWDSHNSSECHFSFNLIGCKNCFFCVNLQNQEYCFLNEKMSKEKYEAKVASVREAHSFAELVAKFIEFKVQFPMKWMNEINTENCTGNYLVNCNECEECYDCEYLERSKYCFDLKKGEEVSYNNMDISAFGLGVIDCYEGGTAGYNSNHCLFGENVWESFDVHYSMLCMNCKHCFGCVGLNHDEYCVFNKQYTKEEYEELVGKIIEHMREVKLDGGQEWGEFFPTEMSPFGYNETMAAEYFPMSREEVEAKEWTWKEKEDPVKGELSEEVRECKESGRRFKILKEERDFYDKWGLPVPELCPDVRHLHRLGQRNPRHLWDRKCDKCGVELKSSYEPGRKEKVYCRKCYLEEVF